MESANHESPAEDREVKRIKVTEDDEDIPCTQVSVKIENTQNPMPDIPEEMECSPAPIKAEEPEVYEDIGCSQEPAQPKPKPNFEKYKQIPPAIVPHKHVVLPVYFEDGNPRAYLKDGPLSEAERHVLLAILGMESCGFRDMLEIMFGNALVDYTDSEDIKESIERYYEDFKADAGTKKFPAMEKSDMIANICDIQKNNSLWANTDDAQLIAAMAVAPDCFSVPITSWC
jgi:hypothetical protein